VRHRIGQGFDVHALVEGYPLIIGGVQIPYDKGSKGHSDGDVLYHAIVDALLGALALGDIGSHFPSSDVRWKGAHSSLFLEHALGLVMKHSFRINNVDATVILQAPQISQYIETMRRNIASILKITSDQVSVKATSTDHLGFTGNGSGLAASAVVLLTDRSHNDQD